MKLSEKKNRWNQAQDYEKLWWNTRSQSIDLEYYKFHAEIIKNYLKDFINLNESKVLEIGCGPGGIFTFLGSQLSVGIDPLEKFFSTVSSFQDFRNKKAIYVCAKGEELPFNANTFDLTVSVNVLDHCESPTKVLSEIRRVVRKDGVFFLWVHTYHIWGKFVRDIMEILKIDKGHPYTFTEASLKSLCNHLNFQIIYSIKTGSYLKSWLREISSGTLKDFIKAALFVTRKDTIFILMNKGIAIQQL